MVALDCPQPLSQRGAIEGGYMKRLILSAILATVAVQANASWEKVLTCDGGAAVVDANTQDRSQVQLVIRDRNIVEYFRRSGVRSEPGMGYSGDEYILSGRNSTPVSSGKDFKAIYVNEPTSYSSSMTAYAVSEGNGIKVTVEEKHDGCPQDCRENPLSMQCESLCVGAGVGATFSSANWYFRDCR
jgi:hypothetical protein